MEICGRDNGFGKKKRREAVRGCVEAYREAMATFADMGNLDVWYAHFDVDALVDRLPAQMDDDGVRAAGKSLKKSKKKNSARAVRKLTEVVDGQLRVRSEPPTIVPMRDLVAHSGKDWLIERFDEESLQRLMRGVLRSYRSSLTTDKRRLVSEYTAVDMAHKVVGVGSVGTRAWIIVMRGADDDDSLVLQVKEAQESVLERFVGKSLYSQHGHRVVAGQRAIQTASDVLLGWCRMPDVNGKMKAYYVRQLSDGKGSIALSLLNAEQLARVAVACGRTLAHAHARTGDRFAIASYLGKSDAFDKAIVSFSQAYADQNERDYQRFMEALEAGEL